MFTWEFIGIAILLYIMCVGVIALLARYVNKNADSYHERFDGGRLVIALVLAPLFLVAIAIVLIADAVWSGLRFMYQFAARRR